MGRLLAKFVESLRLLHYAACTRGSERVTATGDRRYPPVANITDCSASSKTSSHCEVCSSGSVVYGDVQDCSDNESSGTDVT